MNNELKFLLTTRIDSIEDLKKLCTSKEFFNMCKENTYLISKHFLNKYKVDYKDPNNFIYKFNNVKINHYKNFNNVEDTFKLGSIFRLYMKAYELAQINCNGKGITSFPIYPNMIDFFGPNNQLTSFPVQPNMKSFNGANNKLISFPVQPKMVNFFGSNNQLTSFPVQPNMEYFEGSNNQLISFPVQPKMEYFNGIGNNLINFDDQPNMEWCYGDPGICE